MLVLKTLRLPIQSSKKAVPPNQTGASPLHFDLTHAPIIADKSKQNATTGTGSASSLATPPVGNKTTAKTNHNDLLFLPFKVDIVAAEKLFAALNSDYSNNPAGITPSASTIKQSGKATSSSPLSLSLLSVDPKVIKTLLLQVHNGKSDLNAGLVSPPVLKQDKTGSTLPSGKSAKKPDSLFYPFQLQPAIPPIPDEYQGIAELVADLPEDFDLTGWDDLSARQQQRKLQSSGQSKEAQMKLLNASTSLETIAIIQDIQKNRFAYGLSSSQTTEIADELFKIASARIGVKNHDLPLFATPRTANTFLTMLNEKEDTLLASFGFGVRGYSGKREDANEVRGQIGELLTGDASIDGLLHRDSDVFNTADEFFSDMSKLDTLISEVESGKIEFSGEAAKQHYLDYLTSAYNKNDSMYRRQLASIIDEAKLLQFPESQFKSLINELSISQLQTLVDQINEKGVKKLSNPRNFEKLMRDLLSDQDSAQAIIADETHSPIRPRIWNGMDIVEEKNIQIGGYYYEGGQYHVTISCDGDDIEVHLGNKLPSEVSIEVKRTTVWDMIGEQVGLGLKLLAAPAMIVDAAYEFGVYNGMPAFIPENLSPSDLPYLGEFLDKIDPWDHTAHLTKETISLIIVTHYQNSANTEQALVRFNTYKG